MEIAFENPLEFCVYEPGEWVWGIMIQARDRTRTEAMGEGGDNRNSLSFQWE